MTAETMTTVATGGAPPSDKPPLDEMMLAMDVVDTLRRRQRLVEREFDSEGREKDLKQRLRKIYAAQGIEVPDHVLEEGVAALREERFVYKSPAKSLATRLAHVYVTRARWGKWVLGGIAAMLLAWLAYYFMVVMPRGELPERLESAYQSVVEVAKSAEPGQQAQQLYQAATTALQRGEVDSARQALESLQEPVSYTHLTLPTMQ